MFPGQIHYGAVIFGAESAGAAPRASLSAVILIVSAGLLRAGSYLHRVPPAGRGTWAERLVGGQAARFGRKRRDFKRCIVTDLGCVSHSGEVVIAKWMLRRKDAVRERLLGAMLFN